jgi:ribose/xylose/arabinose/galactoside ABC-type transport system permease subunit
MSETTLANRLMPRGRLLSPGGAASIVPLRTLLLIALIVAAEAVLGFLSPNLLSAASMSNALRQATVLWIVTLGATFVITAGEIDLSVASVVALISTLGAWLIRAGYPIPVMLLATLATSVLIGAFNGLVTTQLRVPSFLTTLGSLAIVRGIAWAISLQYIPVLNIGFVQFFRLSPLGVPMPIAIALVLTVLAVVLFHFSKFGVRTRAVGSNEGASLLAGLNVRRQKFIVMVLGSLMAGVGGLVFMGRTNYGMPGGAAGLELQVIASVVLGGTRLGGGTGSIVGATLGALLLTAIFFGIASLGLSAPYQDVARGAAIVLAILLMPR